jgi:hypothetical protein
MHRETEWLCARRTVCAGSFPHLEAQGEMVPLSFPLCLTRGWEPHRVQSV